MTSFLLAVLFPCVFLMVQFRSAEDHQDPSLFAAPFPASKFLPGDANVSPGVHNGAARAKAMNHGCPKAKFVFDGE